MRLADNPALAQAKANGRPILFLFLWFPPPRDRSKVGLWFRRFAMFALFSTSRPPADTGQ